MNFAQVVGGLRMQFEEEHERFLALEKENKRLAALVPGYQPRKHGAMPERIYNALVEHGDKIDWPGIVKLCDIKPEEKQRGAHAIMDLCKCKHVQREGTRRKYLYWATRRD